MCVNLFKLKYIKVYIKLIKYLIMFKCYIKKPWELNNKFGFRKGVFVRLSFQINEKVKIIFECVNKKDKLINSLIIIYLNGS